MEQFSHVLILLTYQTLVCLVMSLSILQRHELSGDLNLLLSYLRKYYQKWGSSDRQTKSLSTLLDVLLVAFQLMLIVAPLTSAIHSAPFPDSPMYLSSCFPSPWKRNSALLTINALFYWIIGTQSLVIFSLHLQSISTSLFFSTPIMAKDLRAGITSRRARQDKLLSLKHLTFEYRCFEIMHYVEMEIYGKLIVQLHTIIYILIIFPSAILIQHSSHMDSKTIAIICSYIIGSCMFWGTILRFGGYYFAQNAKTLRSWGKLDLSCEDKLYMTKFRKSCKPLQIGDQARFKLNKVLILFFIRGISRGVVRVLLTSK
ncbi:hypothetical protein Fcan01_26454 [Folsomia candida]|uniref:Uncharacterized protein n=1 Tax=Folsomia candida TaxID=158441 RepID=A0A226D0R6_FOLCA|nr:hypothetical protein Fcan01_26454 [Folsomia candida]